MADHTNDQRTPVTLASFLELGIPQLQLYGEAATNITGIELDSRVIDPGDLFVAIAGHQRHGVEFVDEAIARGAVAVLTDQSGWVKLSETENSFPIVVIPSARKFLGTMANVVYGRTAERINALGVTGTNGKTTTATMIEAAFIADRRSTGFIGTTGIRIGVSDVPSKRTTPEATTLHGLFAQMGEQSVTDVVMEVSSHALSEDRVGGLHYSVVGFTNLSQDHLDYHHTMEEYFQAKALLFTPQYAAQAVICIDDAWGERLATLATVPVTTISNTGKAADWNASLNSDGEIEIIGPQDQKSTFTLSLPGDFNRANALLEIGRAHV
jgi:UDP-N-acetylmuramoyl-L-alanyl-D-glutamate--2,6-diaminopimelate ligase